MTAVYDAVIIGAGPSGLAAAARLAHFGLRICLVEAHSRLGGLNSWHHVRGIETSSGLHAFTNYRPDGKGALGRLLRQLRLRISDLRLCPQGISSIRFPSRTLQFNNDPDFFREQVASAFPADADAFDRFRKRVRDADEGEITPVQTSARAVMDEFIHNPLLADMLFCPVLFYGGPGGVGDGGDSGRERPDMDWLLFCVVWKCIFESGLACPAGGMRPLWEELARRFREDGGDLVMSAPVTRILHENGAARGVRLADGREIAAGTVFSSAGGAETERLFDPNSPTRPIGGTSIAEATAVLDRPATEAGMTDTVLFYSFDDRLRFAQPDGLVERRSGVACAIGNYRTPAADTRHILKISQLANYHRWKQLAPDAYAEAKRRTALTMREDLVRLGVDPALARDSAGRFDQFDDVFTPLTLERFTGHAGGALYGSPVKSRSGETACGNLFLIGADQGFHGIVGAMLSGVAMANRHILSKGF